MWSYQYRTLKEKRKTRKFPPQINFHLIWLFVKQENNHICLATKSVSEDNWMIQNSSLRTGMTICRHSIIKFCTFTSTLWNWVSTSYTRNLWWKIYHMIIIVKLKRCFLDWKRDKSFKLTPKSAQPQNDKWYYVLWSTLDLMNLELLQCDQALKVLHLFLLYK